MKKVLKNKKGFTLVELIIVIVIIAVLAAIAIPVVSGFVNRANEAATIAEANALRVALLVYLAVAEDDPPATIAHNDTITIREGVSEFFIPPGGSASSAGVSPVARTLDTLWYQNRGVRVEWQDNRFIPVPVPAGS